MIQPKIQEVWFPPIDDNLDLKYLMYHTYEPRILHLERKIVFSEEEFEQFKREFGKEPINVLKDGDVSIDLEKFAVTYKGVEMTLPKKVTQVLHYLMSNKGKVIRRDDILYDIWGKDVVVGDRTVDVHVRKIKIALYDDCISSVKGVGYKWN